MTNVQFLTLTVQEFACRTSPVAIVEESPEIVKIFPNPTTKFIQIETRWPEYDLTIYNHYGIEIKKKSNVTGSRTLIDLSDRSCGA